MPRTVALLLSRACPNQVAPGNETEPQNGDRVKPGPLGERVVGTTFVSLALNGLLYLL